MKQLFTVVDRQHFATIHVSDEGDFDNLETYYNEAEKRTLNPKRMNSSERYLISLVYSRGDGNIADLRTINTETKKSARIRLYEYACSKKGPLPYLVMKDKTDNTEKIVCQLLTDENGKSFWQILRIGFISYKELDLFVRTLKKAGIYKITEPNYR